MFNPFRKKIKVPEGVAFTPARSNPNGQVYTFPDSPQTLADAVPYLYYLHASHKLAEENKCQYCRSLFIADRRGNCRSCGAPK